MTNKKWFFNINGQVTGPLDAAEIENLLVREPNALMWSRGFPEWMSASEWKSKKDLTGIDAENSNAKWRFRNGGKAFGPFSLPDLIHELSQFKDFDNIDVSENEGPWKEVFTVGQLADKLGLSRRAHSRVPILGTVYLEDENGGEMKSYRAITISEGGLGLTDAGELVTGTKVKGTLKSSNLMVDVHFLGDVVYVGNDDYVGLRFNQLPQETQSVILEYVNKFKTTL